MYFEKTPFQEPLHLYWYLFDCLFDEWLKTFVGSTESKILEYLMVYIQSGIYALQRSEDERRVEKWSIQGVTGYNVIDPNLDDDGFLIDEEKNAITERKTFKELMARWFSIKIRNGEIFCLKTDSTS